MTPLLFFSLFVIWLVIGILTDMAVTWLVVESAETRYQHAMIVVGWPFAALTMSFLLVGRSFYLCAHSVYSLINAAKGLRGV
jgi:hypothetical protein